MSMTIVSFDSFGPGHRCTSRQYAYRFLQLLLFSFIVLLRFHIDYYYAYVLCVFIPVLFLVCSIWYRGH